MLSDYSQYVYVCVQNCKSLDFLIFNFFFNCTNKMPPNRKFVFFKLYNVKVQKDFLLTKKTLAPTEKYDHKDIKKKPKSISYNNKLWSRYSIYKIMITDNNKYYIIRCHIYV